MKFPAASNSRIGGAALSFWSSRTLLGRCRTQALSCSSKEMLDTWPHTHLAGSLGQVGSTSNLGIMRGAGAASEESTPLWRSAMVATNASRRTRVMRFMKKPPFARLHAGSGQHSADGEGEKLAPTPAPPHRGRGDCDIVLPVTYRGL